MDAISGISVTSSEKNYTKISNFGSVVCFLEPILWDNVDAQKKKKKKKKKKKIPFQLKAIV